MGFGLPQELDGRLDVDLQQLVDGPVRVVQDRTCKGVYLQTGVYMIGTPGVTSAQVCPNLPGFIKQNESRQRSFTTRFYLWFALSDGSSYDLARAPENGCVNSTAHYASVRVFCGTIQSPCIWNTEGNRPCNTPWGRKA